MCKTKGGKIALTLGILLPTLLIGVPVGVSYALFYDDSISPIVKDDTFNEEVMVKNILSSSIANVNESKAIRIGLSEHDLNQLLLKAGDMMNDSFKKYIDAPYVNIDTKNRTFDLTIHLDAGFFKTKVNLSSSIEFVRDGKVEGHRQGIQFKINQINLKNTDVGSFALKIASKYINNETIDQIFKDAGFNIKVNLEKKVMFYSAHDLMNDVASKTGIDPLFTSIIDMIMEKGFLDIIYDKDAFGLAFKLDMLLSNPLVDPSRDLGFDDKILKYYDDAEILLNNNIIDELHLNDMMDYLINGYDDITSENQAYIDSISDLKLIDIANKKDHKGLDIKKGKGLDQIFKEQLPDVSEIPNIIANNSFDVEFSESNLNETFIASSLIGHSIPLVYKDLNKNYHVNGIFVDDFYINILDEAINFIISVSINGLSTKLVIPCSVVGQDGNKLKLEMKNIHYGQIPASEKMQNECSKYISDALANLNDYFSKDDKYIYFDLSKCIAGVTQDNLKQFLSNAKMSTNLVANKAEENGKLKINFKLDK